MKKWFHFFIIMSAFSLNTPVFAEGTGSTSKSMVYLYGSDSATYEKQLAETNGMVQTVAPDYFHLNENGDLTSTIDSAFVKKLQQEGYIVTPFLSNDWDQSIGIKAINNKDNLVNELVKAVTDNELDGIDIDIENLPSTLKEQQTSFIQALSDQLKPKGKILSIAVPPIQSDTPTGWAGSYDYKKIGELVDYVFVMGYDYSYPNGPLGPVAPLSWVDDSLKYMVTQIPPEKMILGIPFYGRYWSSTKKGAGINDSKILELINQGNGSPHYDEASASMEVNLPSVNGQSMDIWFDNPITLKQKLQLVDKYHLHSWGAWHLGQEIPGLWNTFSENTPMYWDITGHWAEKEIVDLSEQHLLSGYEDFSFRPEQKITREEVAALLERVKKLNTAAIKTFQDVPADRWSYSSIGMLADQGMMGGYPDGSFNPDHPITRAELASVLNRCFPGVTADGSSVSPALTDIQDHWAKNSIITLQQAGIIGGYPDGSFRPDQPVTRAEAAALVWRITQSSHNTGT